MAQPQCARVPLRDTTLTNSTRVVFSPGATLVQPLLRGANLRDRDRFTAPDGGLRWRKISRLRRVLISDDPPHADRQLYFFQPAHHGSLTPAPRRQSLV